MRSAVQKTGAIFRMNEHIYVTDIFYTAVTHYELRRLHELFSAGLILGDNSRTQDLNIFFSLGNWTLKNKLKDARFYIL